MLRAASSSNRVTLWAAILTAVLTVVFAGLAITTLPRSGPLCQSGCVGYPYTDVAAYVPRDYLWMYPAIVLMLLIIVLVHGIHDQIDESRRVLSGVAVTLTGIGAGALIIDYGIQLGYLQPALLLGEIEGLSPWSQYNPHGVFIALENIGYALLNLAFGFIGIAMLRTPSRLGRAAGWIFAAGGILTVLMLVVFSAFYRVSLDYRFELVAISITWLVLIAAPIVLSVALVRQRPPHR